jgi:hypothetical protein
VSLIPGRCRISQHGKPEAQSGFWRNRVRAGLFAMPFAAMVFGMARALKAAPNPFTAERPLRGPRHHVNRNPFPP